MQSVVRWIKKQTSFTLDIKDKAKMATVKW